MKLSLCLSFSVMGASAIAGPCDILGAA
eukprot:COSAG02_NODE_55058_length_292_cov_1.347150_1_plen_27_part_10